MATTTVPVTSKSASELESFFRSMQVQTLNVITLLLAIFSVWLYSYGFQNLDNTWCFVLATGLLVILALDWVLRQRSFGLAAVWLVLGCLAAVYIPVYWGGIPAAAALLVLPAGLATLTMDIWGGGITGALV